MDPDFKKTALRIIPYGIYVVTAKTAAGEIAAATVNWVTQTSFEPPLVVVAVKAESAALNLIDETRHFALNFLGKGQQGLAFAFFKPADADDGTINGEDYHDGVTGAPVLDGAPASVECRVVDVVAHGDHHLVVGEVVNAQVRAPIEGRPDVAGLHMNELGENVFYGG